MPKIVPIWCCSFMLIYFVLMMTCLHVRRTDNITACDMSGEKPYFSFQLMLWLVNSAQNNMENFKSFPLLLNGGECSLHQLRPALLPNYTGWVGVGTEVGGVRRLLSPSYQWLRFASATFACRVTGKVPILGLIRKWVSLSFSWEEARKQLHNLCFYFEMAPPYSHVGKKESGLVMECWSLT